jgi:hypothetical protein
MVSRLRKYKSLDLYALLSTHRKEVLYDALSGIKLN